MITQIQTSNYRCLKSVKQGVRRFQILVGPNASGKSAFLDVLSFLRTLISQNLEAAISERTENFHDLVWGREGSSFVLGVEAGIPESHRLPEASRFSTIAYEVSVHADPLADVALLRRERVAMRDADAGIERVVALREGRATQFFYENGIEHGFKPHIHRKFSLLTHLPTLNEFPAATWLKDLLSEELHPVSLKTEELRAPSPPYKGKATTLSGAHLARFAAQLRDDSPELFEAWLKHLRTSLPDLETIRTVLRPEDRHRYVMLRYSNGVELPSWVISDGTLRLMALTVLAYMPHSTGIYLVEEPEGGLHPTAIETIHQSLSSFYHGQVLVATHSPVLLSLAKPEDILCFNKSPDGTQIVSGDAHPALRDWKGEVNLSDLFAAGVLG